MSTADEITGRAHVALTLDYTDDELARFDTLLAQQNLAENKPTIWEGWPAFIGLGFIAAVGATLLAIAAGIVTARSSAGLAALCFGTYWLGITAPGQAAGIAGRRRRKAAFDAFRAEWNGTCLLASQRGIWLRREGLRGFIGPSAIHKASSADGLLLLHLRAGPPIMLPQRLLTAEQREFLTSLAP